MLVSADVTDTAPNANHENGCKTSAKQRPGKFIVPDGEAAVDRKFCEREAHGNAGAETAHMQQHKQERSTEVHWPTGEVRSLHAKSERSRAIHLDPTTARQAVDERSCEAEASIMNSQHQHNTSVKRAEARLQELWPTFERQEQGGGAEVM